MNYFSRLVSLRSLLIGVTSIIVSSCTEYNPLSVEADEPATVFMGSGDRKFLALDALTGIKKWEFTADEVVSVTPAVSNGLVYVGSDHNFYALDAQTGTKKWEFKTGPRPSSRYTPVVSNGNVYLLSDNRTILYALDAVTGAQKWNATSKSFSANGGWYSDPLVADGVVYLGGTDSTLYALDAATGAKKWNFRTGSGFYTRPDMVNGIVYAGSYDGKLYALNATTGAQKWAATIGGYTQFPKIIGKTIYITNWSELVALDLTTGIQKWHFFPEVNNGYTGNTGLISISNGTVYGGFVPLDWNDGFIYTLDAATGAKKTDLWPWPGGLSGVGIRALVVNGSLFVGGKDNTLRSLDAVTRATKWEFKADSYIAYPLCVVTKQGQVINGN